MSIARSFVARRSPALSNRLRAGIEPFLARALDGHAVALRLGERLLDGRLDAVHDPIRARGEREDRAPQVDLLLLDLARRLELLLGAQNIELRHVAEVHRQEARRLVVATLALAGGAGLGHLDLSFVLVLVLAIGGVRGGPVAELGRLGLEQRGLAGQSLHLGTVDHVRFADDRLEQHRLGQVGLRRDRVVGGRQGIVRGHRELTLAGFDHSRHTRARYSDERPSPSALFRSAEASASTLLLLLLCPFVLSFSDSAS